MRNCPECGTVYSPMAMVCSRDGAVLTDAPGFRDGRAIDAAAALVPGTLVAGRFSIEREIGDGGMGIVYRAVQRPLGRPVALKLLRETVSWDEDKVKRFEQEARAMSHLQHRNTVRVFDFGKTEEGHLYLAMEILEGRTLGDALHAKSLGIPDAMDIADQLLASLEEAHAKGIVHRDLKPDNVFLTTTDAGETEVKVLDFGIAKVIHGDLDVDELETQAGTVFGTPRYMSPEQAQGREIDGRSDLYAVGVLLYEMVTGDPPFDTEDAVVVMAKHIRELPPPPRSRDPYARISIKLDRVIMKALAKDPDERFADATAFRAALQDAMPSVLRYERASGVTLGVDRAVRRAGAPLRWVLAAALALGLGALAAYQMMPGADADGTRATLASSAAAPSERPATSSEAQPTAPPPIQATLISDPPGAEVWLGDERLGVTPLQHDLEAGSVSDVVLRLEGYRDTPFAFAAIAPPQEVRLHRRRQPRSNDAARTAAMRPRTTPTRAMSARMSTPSMMSTRMVYERFD